MPTISYSGFGFYHPGNIIDFLVELWTENPRVGGSIPPLGTIPPTIKSISYMDRGRSSSGPFTLQNRTKNYM